jgi:hypothetical protein
MILEVKSLTALLSTRDWGSRGRSGAHFRGTHHHPRLKNSSVARAAKRSSFPRSMGMKSMMAERQVQQDALFSEFPVERMCGAIIR